MKDQTLDFSIPSDTPYEEVTVVSDGKTWHEKYPRYSEDPIYDAILGHLSALQSRVNGLLHHYKYSDYLEEEIRKVVEKMAQVREDVQRLIKMKEEEEEKNV